MAVTAEDFLIWVTGVVGRAMGSGNFGPSQMEELTRNAVGEFERQLAPKAALLPRAEKGGYGRPGGSSASSSPPRAPQAAPGQTIQPETKPFSQWGGDKAYFGKTGEEIYGMPVREVDWAMWVDQAVRGDKDAKRALEIMANGKVGDDPKWQRANAQKIARAKACLEMVKNTPPPVDDGGPPEQTPF